MNHKSFEFNLIDTFTRIPLQGNPCAVLFDADGLADEEMLKIAKEMNQSETAFVVRSQRADWGARYFTPEREIPMAGHPTIATIHGLLITNRISMEPSKISRMTLELRAGVIPIEVDRTQENARITMFQGPPQFLRCYSNEEVLPIFGLKNEDCLIGAKIQTVSTGTPMLMIPLANSEALRKVQMNVSAYRSFRDSGDFFSPHFFCLSGATAGGRTFARHLGTPPDSAEDAFTGSATGCMAAFLFRYGFISETRWIAEQGHWMGRPGQAAVEVVGSPENIEAIKVGGEAVSVIKGTLTI